MSKFKNTLTLTHKDLEAKRALIIEEDTKASADDIIKVVEKDIRTLKRDLMELEDLGKENSTDLRPVHKDFKPQLWFETVANKRLELALLTEKLNIYKETYQEFFGEEKSNDSILK